MDETHDSDGVSVAASDQCRLHWPLLADEDWQRLGRDLRLSPRELELVRHIFDGRKLYAAARAMGLSLGTVKTYSQRLHHKLGVNDQRELILAVVEAHLQRTDTPQEATPLQPRTTPTQNGQGGL